MQPRPARAKWLRKFAPGAMFLCTAHLYGQCLGLCGSCASLDLLEEENWQQLASKKALRERGLPLRRAAGVADVRVLGGIGVVETPTCQHFYTGLAEHGSMGYGSGPSTGWSYAACTTSAEDVAQLCTVVAGHARGRGAHDAAVRQCPFCPITFRWAAGNGQPFEDKPCGGGVGQFGNIHELFKQFQIEAVVFAAVFAKSASSSPLRI